MDYGKLSQDEFDAIVTGELTHRALALEFLLNDIICEYFIGGNNPKEDDFRQLILDREGLTAQAKIGIVRAMLPLFGEIEKQANLKSILTKVEKSNSERNAMAHGQCMTDPNTPHHLKIGMVSRSGKEKVIEITPDSHRESIAKLDQLIESLTLAKKNVCDY
jgi:hypothetical protein